jgi:hypothetical protein
MTDEERASVEGRKSTERLFLARGPSEATVTATYERDANRIRLDITADADTAYVNASVTRGNGLCRDALWPAAGLLADWPPKGVAPVGGSAVIYDYLAPLNMPSEYLVTFYQGPRRILKFARTAAVTPRDDRHWLKRPAT